MTMGEYRPPPKPTALGSVAPTSVRTSPVIAHGAKACGGVPEAEPFAPFAPPLRLDTFNEP